jgi:hypothetical protein
MATTFPFRWTTAYRWAALPFGVTPGRASVRVDRDDLVILFGPWTLRTTTSNVVACEETSGYSFAKTAGPAHLSFSDRGVTFATNGERGLCMRFAAPVPAIDPLGRIRHPGATVTVDDIAGLRRALGHPSVGSSPPTGR